MNEHEKPWDGTWEPAYFIEKDGAEKLERFLAKIKSSTSDYASFIWSSDWAESSSDEKKDYELEKIKKYRVLR